ncbi:MAG: prepilin-type N-terminal cleavage/methylation domain-containing protein [Candidatus Omnitrophica bacterium]|nr:prepilin-type N-terminal cleavage/methylation domain-containing protein [Candidatus Omnitrophota bacterium]MDD5488550.1 prepilin-type N-terminal cleavage/methylation domain-containing protein [Candidatus Omnitrophota bacterium]
MNNKIYRRSGFSLTEILIATAVVSIIVGSIFYTFDSCLKAYTESQKELTAFKFLDAIGYTIINGDRKSDGLRGALELKECAREYVEYVPLWEDTSNLPPYPTDNIFPLNRPFMFGSGEPIVEVAEGPVGGEKIYTYYPLDPTDGFDPSTAQYTSGMVEVKPLDQVLSTKAMRILYWPDWHKAAGADAVVKIEFDSANQRILKHYAGETWEIRPTVFNELSEKITVTGCTFEYYDRYYDINDPATTPLVFDATDKIPVAELHSITAVKITLKTDMEGLIREIPLFVNLRNSRTTGALKIMDTSTFELELPPSADLKVLKVYNVTGPNPVPGNIEIEVTPDNSLNGEQTWKIILELDEQYIDGRDRPVILRYRVEYPTGTEQLVRDINQDCRIPFDMLDLFSGAWDLDIDFTGPPPLPTEIKFMCSSRLRVTTKDAHGVGVSVRP